VVVFEANLGNVSCYRIPSVVQTPSGAILAFAEARHDPGCGDDKTHEIALRRSFDGGRTWDALSFAVGNGSYYVGNPTAVVVPRANGTLERAPASRILLLVSLHTPDCGGNCVSGNAIVHSDDDGSTWSAPQELTGEMGKAAKARFGPGVALRVGRGPHTGRLIAPCAMGTYTFDDLLISDDEGATWTPSSTSFPKVDEAQLTQLPNGSLMLLMRHEAEPWLGKAAATSDDGGDTWTDVRYPWNKNATSQLESPVCQYAPPSRAPIARRRLAVASSPRAHAVPPPRAAATCQVLHRDHWIARLLRGPQVVITRARGDDRARLSRLGQLVGRRHADRAWLLGLLIACERAARARWWVRHAPPPPARAAARAAA